jgi:hypothetical protein
MAEPPEISNFELGPTTMSGFTRNHAREHPVLHFFEGERVASQRSMRSTRRTIPSANACSTLTIRSLLSGNVGP